MPHKKKLDDLLSDLYNCRQREREEKDRADAMLRITVFLYFFSLSFAGNCESRTTNNSRCTLPALWYGVGACHLDYLPLPALLLLTVPIRGLAKIVCTAAALVTLAPFLTRV